MSGRDWNGNRGRVVDRTHGGCAWVFAGLARWLQGRDTEGIVFQRPDGRMTKVKPRDSGLKRGLAKPGA